MKSKYALIALVVLGCFVASTAAGSVLTISPRISVSESYTDNTDLTENHKKSDFTTTVYPSVTAEFQQKHMGFEFFYDYEHEFYYTETQNNSSRHNAGIQGWAEISKHTRISLGQRFQRVEDPLREGDRILLPDEDPYLSRDSNVRRAKDTYYTFSSNAGLNHQFGDKDYFSFNYIYSLREDKSDDGNSNNRHAPGIALSYWFTPKIGIDTTLDYTRGEFDDDDDFDDVSSSLKLSRKITKHLDVFVSYRYVWRDFEGGVVDAESDYQTNSSSIGISYQIDENTSLHFGGGYFYQKRDEDEDEEGFFADIDVTKKWVFPRGGFHLSGSSGIDRDEFGSDNRGFERYYGIIGRLTYGFTRHLSSSLSLSYRRSEYINSDDDSIDDRFIANIGLHYQVKRWMHISTNYSHSLLYEDKDDVSDGSGPEDENQSFDIGITLSPKRWVSVSMNYEYRQLNSDIGDDDYEENRASLTVTFVPVRPYRKVY